ncbi:hypothetical protein AVEN_131085-1 [Araneus ventricosus]|uniref:Transposable element Tc3 transposase n=1 Tax=Araneus ventricosus TaxID=182803 RepID=A0A4Y2D117_ARAVE|nr:hypothetical protein AVEN_131085-1 [Araneus ventricosus]
MLDRGEPQRLAFAVRFLNRMADDLSWPWKILWSDEAHFYLNGTVNTQNCRIWAKENPRMHNGIPYILQSCLSGVDSRQHSSSGHFSLRK